MKLLLAALALLCALLPGAHAQTETLASQYRWILDPEFNLDRNLMTWVDPTTGNIWVNAVDPATGAFVPDNGQGTLIEAGAAPVGGLGFTLNGPEWALGSPSDYVVYTRSPAGTQETPQTAVIGVAWQDSTGTWTRKSLSTPQRNGPFGSLSRASQAKISYQDAAGTHYWRTIADAASETPFPGLTAVGLTPAVRFVPGENMVVYPVPDAGGTPQVMFYDLDTAQYTQLTVDAGAKDQPWMWRAPDYGNALVVVTTIDKSTLALYAPATDGSYQQAMKVAAPLNGTYFSTEPFTYQGASYALVQVSEAGKTYPGSIWLVGLNPIAPFLRRLTPSEPDHARADPEIFFTSAGPIVFFSRLDQTKGDQWLCMACLEGEYRVDTGLPAPLFAGRAGR